MELDGYQKENTQVIFESEDEFSTSDILDR